MNGSIKVYLSYFQRLPQNFLQYYSRSVILYQTCLVHIHDESSFLWKQESCLLLTLAAEKPDLSLLAPMVSVISTYPPALYQKRM